MNIPLPGKAAAVKAGLWSTLDIAVRQGLQFVVSIILARLLTPSDFGLVAILAFFTSLSTTFLQGGFTTALIRHPGITHEDETAVFWCIQFLSAAMAAAMWGSGGAIARFYAQPVLAPLMMVAGAQIVVTALGSVHAALLARALRFDLTMIAGITASVLSGIVGVTAALHGWGVWALAAQMVTAAATGTVSLWAVSPWRPGLRFRLEVLKPLTGFGAWIGLSSMLDVVYMQGSALIIGKLYSIRDLGFYNRAASTQQLPAFVVSSVIGRVTLPLFAARAAEPDTIRRGLRLAIGLVMLVNAPMMIGLSLLAAPTMALLFGPRWLSAAPILSVLALSGILYPLHALNLQTLLAHGESARFFRIEVAKKLLGVLFLAIGAIFGVRGLAWAQVALSIGALPLNAAPMGERIGYGTMAQLRDLTGLVIPLAAMAAVTAMVQGALLSPLATLAVAVPSGALAYITLCAVLRVKAFGEATTLLRGVVTVRRPSKVPVSSQRHGRDGTG